MPKKTNPSAAYDITKVITVILVVLAHSTRMYTPAGVVALGKTSSLLGFVTDYIYAFHMPLFMLVSGAVYGLCIQRGKYAKKIPFVANKAKRLLIPYAVFGLFYVAPVMCLLGLTEQNYLQYCIYGIGMSMNSRHLWFLLALFNIFVYAIVIRGWLLKSHKTRLAVVALSCAIFAVAKYLPGRFQIIEACTYQLYFVLGACLHFYYDKISAFAHNIKYLWIVFPVLLAVKFYFGLSFLDFLVDDFVGIWMILMAAILLENNEKLRNAKWFRVLKDYSMGIFLFHPMIIYACYYFFGAWNIPPVLMSIGIALLSTLASMLLTWILRKCKLGVVMGE